jgi:hypothetical protein
MDIDRAPFRTGVYGFRIGSGSGRLGDSVRLGVMVLVYRPVVWDVGLSPPLGNKQPYRCVE